MFTDGQGDWWCERMMGECDWCWWIWMLSTHTRKWKREWNTGKNHNPFWAESGDVTLLVFIVRVARLSLYTTVLRRPFEPSLLLGHQVLGVNGDGAIGLNVVHMRVYRQCFYWRRTIRCQSREHGISILVEHEYRHWQPRVRTYERQCLASRQRIQAKLNCIGEWSCLLW